MPTVRTSKDFRHEVIRPYQRSPAEPTLAPGETGGTMHTIIEPFRIKSVEPIEMSTAEQRQEWIAEAGYNLFKLPAQRVLIDLLTTRERPL